MALCQKWVFVSALASRFVAVKSIFGRDTEKWRRPYLDKNVSWKDLQKQMRLFIYFLLSCDARREEYFGSVNERQSSFVWLLQIEVCFSLRNRQIHTASGAKPRHIFTKYTLTGSAAHVNLMHFAFLWYFFALSTTSLVKQMLLSTVRPHRYVLCDIQEQDAWVCGLNKVC